MARKRKAIWLAIAIFLIALLPRITTLGGTFIVNDEPLYWLWANDFVAALVQLDWYGTLIGKGYPAVTVMWVHTLGAAVQFVLDLIRGYPVEGFWHRAALDQPLVFEMLADRRVTVGVINALLITLIFWQARQLMGEAIAFLGAGLMAVAPFLLADARTMRGDALMSSLMLVSVLSFLLFIRDRRWRQLIMSGLSLGLAILTKIVAIPVFGFGAAAVAVYAWRQGEWSWGARLRWITVTLAVWGAVTTLTVFALWPALWVAPLEVFFFIQDYANSSIDGRLNFFWGQLTHDEPLPLFYPTAFLFRTTPLVLLGVLVTASLVLACGWQCLRPGRSQADRRLSLERLWSMPPSTRWTLLALGAYCLIYWLVLNAGALKRDRYLMPVFAAVMFIAAAGLIWLVNRLRRRWPGDRLPVLGRNGRWVWVLFGLALAWNLSQILATHPYYYTYWNPLMGGGRVAMGAMMAEGGVDSAALVYLNQKPNAAQETVALLTARDYAPAYAGKTVRLSTTAPWITADYVVLRQYHYQTEKMEPDLLEYLYRQPPEHLIEQQGYIWAWIYPGPAAQYYAGSMLDGKAKLLGYNLDQVVVSPDKPLSLKLFWKNKGRIPGEEIFIRLVDAGGFVWAETAAHPLPEFEDLAYEPEAIVEGQAELAIPPGTPPALYFLKMGVSGGSGEPDAGEFALPADGNRITVERPAQPAAVNLPEVMNQKLGTDLTLLGAELPDSFMLTPQTPLQLTLYWRVDQDVAKNYVLSLRLLNKAGEEVAYWLGQPTRGIYPSPNWRQSDLVRDPWTLDLHEAQPGPDVSPGRYTLKVALFNADAGQQVGQATLGALEVSDRPRLFEEPSLEHMVGARLGQSVSLVGYDLAQAPLTGGARFIIDLGWQALQPVPASYTVFVQILGPDGQVVGQHDGIPVGGILPTTAWETGEYIIDRRRIDFPVTQAGQYRLITGMYNSQTGERLPVTTAGDAAGDDFLQLYTFTYEGESVGR